MMGKFTIPKGRPKRITSADVGRYLKHLSALNRDPLTGNAAMSAALLEIATLLIAGKAAPAPKVLNQKLEQGGFNFEENYDLHALSLEKVREIIARPDLTKSELSAIGMERFGIAKSRMDRIPREEIVKAISAAMQHEESLAIISEEAQRHARTS